MNVGIGMIVACLYFGKGLHIILQSNVNGALSEGLHVSRDIVNMKV